MTDATDGGDDAVHDPGSIVAEHERRLNDLLADAEAFRADQGGELVAFDEVTPSTLER